uniref:Uncharacterized protein n=1 Tax=Knipowitschia caucasica TaxID=637954 RepID=A0AAV2L8G1_KNICA
MGRRSGNDVPPPPPPPVDTWAASWSAAHSPARSRGPQLRRRLELAARTAARSFSHRAELDLPVPQRRNCSPTPTKKEHRGPSRLKPPPGFPGPIPAPCSRVWERLECVCARSSCVRKTEVFDRLTQTPR